MRVLARHLLTAFLGVLFIVLLLVEPLQATGRSSGSFGKSSGSWGKSSSSSKPSSKPSSSSSKPSSSSSKPSSSTPSSSKPSSTSSWGSRPSSNVNRTPAPVAKPRNASPADEAAYQKSVQSNSFGKSSTYKSDSEAREAAVTDFRQKYGSSYPTEFKDRPASRPEYIPDTTTTSNGRNTPVEWRNEGGRGGYYYFDDALRTWMLYDLMRDSAHRDRYMYRHGYDPSGRTYTESSSTEGRSGSRRVWVWIGGLLLLVIVVVIGLYYYYSMTAARAPTSPRRRDKDRDDKPPRREEPMRTKQDVSYWERVKPGDMVNLKDQQTLELLMREGTRDFTLGVDLTVKSVKRITEQKNLLRWTLAELEGIPLKDAESTWYLLVKIVDEVFDVRIVFIPQDFRPGNRADLVARGVNWLFKAPADENNFNPAELDFADGIDQTLDDGRAIVYERKPQGLMFGTMTETPKPSGLEEPQFVSVLEYRADADCPNPELVILEIGGVVLANYQGARSEAEAQATRRAAELASSGGGLILLLQGTNVNTHDVELMAVK